MTLRRALKRLRLRPGDVLLCRDSKLVNELVRLRDVLKFPAGEPPVTIVVEPDRGCIKRMRPEQLDEMITDLTEIRARMPAV